MEQNNPKLPPTTFCRSGCGFYGNESFEGLCSKCYKDQIKRKQSSSPVGSSAGRVSPVGSSQGEREVINSVSQTLAKTNLGTVTETSTTSSTVISTSSSTSTTPSVETATPTIQVPNIDKDKEEGATGGVDTSDTAESSVDAAKDKKKKNRCHTCKKKVGLTGFECRCGGLYCSLHRYSDKHDCTFNYKELAQQQIRKNNPVIVGEKVKKI